MLKKMDSVEMENVVGGVASNAAGSKQVADTVKEVFKTLEPIARGTGGKVEIDIHCEPKTDTKKTTDLDGKRPDGLTQHKETTVITKEGPYACRVDGKVIVSVNNHE